MALKIGKRTWFDGNWSAREWRLIRWVAALVWLPWVGIAVFSYTAQPVPTGIARWIDLSFLTWPGINVAVVLLAVVASGFYVRGKRMLIATGTMLTIGILTYTLHDSQGAFQRNEVANLVLLGQFVALLGAWWKKRKGNPIPQPKLRNQLVFNSQQMIVAPYFISAITKLNTSGLHWIGDSPNIALQVYKANMEMYFSLEWDFFRELGIAYSEFMAANPLLVQILFAGALSLELFCVLALLNRRIARVVGWMMVAMHVGILLLFGVIFLPLVAFIVVLLIGFPGKDPQSVREIAG
jgi:hypothetical protein